MLQYYNDGGIIMSTDNINVNNEMDIRHSDLPPLTRRPIIHVDLTPDDMLPLRILFAYRDNCKAKWAGDANGEALTNPLLIQMNEDNDKRVVILDRAIARLYGN